MNKVFDLTNRYIILATPLILYTLFTTIYLAVSISGGNLVNFLVAIVLFYLMTGVFISGWFNMIKIAILQPNLENPNDLIKEFPAGVGEFFLSSLCSLAIMFLLMGVLLLIAYCVGIKLIGDIGVSPESLSVAMQSVEKLKIFIQNLSKEQLLRINCWNFLLLGTIMLANYLVMLYLPALFFKNKNPIIAFGQSIKDLFSKKILKTTSLFFLIVGVNCIISLLFGFLGANPIMHFILTLINFYFITVVGVGLFYYYDENFVKVLVGKNVDIEI